MNLGQSFSMAFKAIRNNKMRSFLTMLGIIIGVCAVIILVTLVSGMRNIQMESFEKMGTNKININYWSEKDLTQEIYGFCTSRKDLFMGVTPEINSMSPVKYQQKSRDSTTIYMGSDQYDKCNNYELEKGRMFSYADVKYKYRVVVLGAAVAKELFNYVDPLGKTIKIGGENFTVIGVFKEKYGSQQYSPDDMVLIPYTWQRTIMKSAVINNFSARAVNSEMAKKATEELQAFLSTKFSNPWDFNVYSNQEWIDQSNESMQMMALILGGIAGISLIVGGIGIMNIMLVSVTERTREIGIRKAIGADRRGIIIQFLIEAATISAIGGLIGILIGVLGSIVLGKLIFQIFVQPDVPIMIGAFLFSVGLGMFFGIYPAAKASKLNPIDALRAE